MSLGMLVKAPWRTFHLAGTVKEGLSKWEVTDNLNGASQEEDARSAGDMVSSLKANSAFR